ncbi:MAG: hypothetical protein GXO09_03120 [Crenarchaeota archaeon]|nr:hypothetical protein [Thermoproteota archaeon]
MYLPPEMLTYIATRTLRLWLFLAFPPLIAAYAARSVGVKECDAVLVVSAATLLLPLVLMLFETEAWFMLLGD